MDLSAPLLLTWDARRLRGGACVRADGDVPAAVGMSARNALVDEGNRQLAIVRCPP